jgi:diguanylate cyclase (GGDEF)-like protein/PAS domain S-box-containing protein
MAKEPFPMTQAPRFRPEPSALLALAVGIAFLGLLLVSHLSWRQTAHGHLPLFDNISHLKLQLSRGHLLLEEIIAGDDEIEIGQVWEAFDAAREGARASLDGESPVSADRIDGGYLNDPEIRADFTVLSTTIDRLRELADARWLDKETSGIGAPIESRFDQLHADALGGVMKIERRAHAMVNEQVRRHESIFFMLIAVWCVALTGLVVLLQRQGSRRRAVQEDLAAVESRYREVVERAGDWVWEIDAAGLFTYVSPQSEPSVGYPTDKLIGDSYDLLLPEEDRPAWRKRLARYAPFRETARLRLAGDQRFGYFEIVGNPRVGSDGTGLGYRGSCRDVTASVVAAKEAARSHQILDIVARAQSSYISDLNAMQVLESLLVDILSLTSSRFGLVGEVVEASRSRTGKTYARVRAFYDLVHGADFTAFYESYPDRSLEFHNMDNLLGAAALSGEPVIANDPADDPRSGGTPTGHPPIASFLGLPLMKGSAQIGFLGLANREGGYTETDVRLLQPVLVAVGGILAALYSENERKKTEGKLALAAKVFENATEGVLVTTTEGVITTVNPAVTDITGYTEEELIGKNPRVFRSDRHTPDFYDDMWRTILTTGKWQGEIWNRRKGGEAYPEWLTITAIKNEIGRTIQYISVFHDLSQIKRSEEQLRYQAYHDALTRLPNRVLFMDRLKQALAFAHRTKGKLAVVYVSVDRFKKFNESLGHPVGDRLLVEVAERLKGLLREGDTVARWGGDEFTFILEDVGSNQHAGGFAARILKVMAEPFLTPDNELYLSVSVGVSLYPSCSDDAEGLMKTADLAMFRAKERGGNTFQSYTPAMGSAAFETLTMERDMRKAIDKEEFVVYYQPKMSLLTGEMEGVEALIRWRHPDMGLVPPNKFIPIAEETGLIVPIGEQTLRAALRQLKKWHEKGFPHMEVSVNLSALQFSEENLFETVKDALEESGVSPRRLDLEITESTVMRDVEAAIDTLARLSDMGVKISIDDFGTGYSSLAYLKRFPIDTLKIDRSFVSDIPENADDAAIAEAIISLSHSLKMKVVAEGVETVAQLEFLREKRCDEMQGFLFSPPVPADRLEEMLQSGRSLRDV